MIIHDGPPGREALAMGAQGPREATPRAGLRPHSTEDALSMSSFKLGLFTCLDEICLVFFGGENI